MADFVTLACPNCGANLQITPDIARFACMHCGTQQVVKRSGGIVTLGPVVEGLARVQRGTDKTAAELAIRRLTDELAIARAEESAAKDALANFEVGGELAAPPIKASSMSTLEITLIVSFFVLAFCGTIMRSSTTLFYTCGSLALICLVLYWPARHSRLNDERKAYEIALSTYEGTLQMYQTAIQAKRDAINGAATRVAELQSALESNRRIANS